MVENHTGAIANPGDGRFLVLSDMHFGTPESSINDARYNEALVAHIVARGPWKEIIFTGDLLDVNLSTLTRAIEGGTWPGLGVPLLGFRGFLEALDRKMRASERRIRDLARR